MRAVITLLVCAGASFAGYTSKATVTFAAASGSGTDTDITLAFSGSDARLRTAVNGGQVQHTASRVGITVPDDFILTSDPTCATLSGNYLWGIESYSASVGTVTGWVKIPTLTTSAPVVLTVCVGNAAISTYQGGGPGAEFDLNTVAAYHYPDGTTPSAKDFSANALDGAISGARAVAGKIDGGLAFQGPGLVDSVAYGTHSSLYTPLNGSFTIELWINPGSTAQGIKFGAKGFSNSRNIAILSEWGAGVSIAEENAAVIASSGTSLANGAWYHVAWTQSGNTYVLYINGAVSKTGAYTFQGSYAGAYFSSDSSGSLYTDSGLQDELRIAGTARTAGWIATEYTNQTSMPVIGAFTPLSDSVTPPELSVVGFIF